MELTIWHYVAFVLLGISVAAAIDRLKLLWRGVPLTRKRRIVVIADLALTFVFLCVFFFQVLS